MCGRLVNLDTVARVLAEYYHLKTDTQLAALDEALSRVPAETVGKELFGISEQLVVPHRNYKYLSDYWCKCGWHLGKRGDVNYCANCGSKVMWDG